MSIILDRAKAAGAIVFDVDYRRGSLLDRSPYAAAATITAPVNWARTKHGNALQFGAGVGNVAYAHSSAIALTSTAFTMVVMGKFGRQGSSRLISKRNAGGTGYELYTTATTLGFYDGTNLRDIALSISGRNMLVATLASAGSTPIAYADGSLVGSFSGSITVSANTMPLVIGNIYSGSFPCFSPIHRVVILNTALTPQDIAQLYTELMSERFPLRAYSFGSRIEAPKDPPGTTALLKIDFTTRLPDGRLADLSGNGWHGTVKPGFVAGPGMCGNSLVANSASRTYVDFGDVTPINGAQKLTVLWAGGFGDRTPTRIVINKGAASNTRLDVNINNGGNLVFNNQTKVGYTADTTTAPECFWATVYDGSLSAANMVKMFVDGSARSMTVVADMPSALPNNAGTSLAYGRLSWSDVYPPPEKSNLLALYNTALTPEQIGYVYRQIARRSTFKLDMQRVPVSLANMVGPCEVPGTPLRITGGAWQVSEDSSGRHWINNVSDGAKRSAYLRSEQAYGTWIFNVSLGSFTDATFALTCLQNSFLTTEAARTGYLIYIWNSSLYLLKVPNGSGSTTLFSKSAAVAANTAYSIAVTRSSDGAFTIYIKGGAYNSWTKLTATAGSNPVTDATYTTSLYSGYAAENGSNGTKFGSMYRFQGVLTQQDLQELAG